MSNVTRKSQGWWLQVPGSPPRGQNGKSGTPAAHEVRAGWDGRAELQLEGGITPTRQAKPHGFWGADPAAPSLSALTRRSPGCPLLGKSWRRRLVSRCHGEEKEGDTVRGGSAGGQPPMAAPFPPPAAPAPQPLPVLGLAANELHHAAQGDHCGQTRGSAGAQGHPGVTREQRALVTGCGGVTYRERGG